MKTGKNSKKTINQNFPRAGTADYRGSRAYFCVISVTNTLRSLLVRDTVRSAALVRALPFALFIGILAVRGSVADALADLPAWDFRWLYAVQAAVACLALWLLRKRYSELARLRPRILPAVLSVAAGLAVFVLWITPQPGWAHIGAPVAGFVPLDANGGLRWDLVAVRTFGAVLVVPVMEELFWRSFLMRWIDRRDFLRLPPGAASSTAVLASSAVFALAHDLWLAGFIAGLVYAHIYRKTGNIWYGVAAHATTNLALAAWVVRESAWSYW
jgi:CAAX prenyl protease-like protein